MKTQFFIQDWAGNRMNFGTFKTFDDAGSYLLSKFSDDDLQEYYIEEEEVA